MGKIIVPFCCPHAQYSLWTGYELYLSDKNEYNHNRIVSLYVLGVIM